ncbi:DUF6119 family protein [Amycolatopsis magusensis]|uniref:DUF6119 family protein n=1 Tax=Amycolatopsis magusensis TaxID=882444 RepID=UPI003C2D71FC
MRITLYLLTEGAEVSRQSLKNSSGYSEVPLVSSAGAHWKLFVHAMSAQRSKWTDNVLPIVKDPKDLNRLRSQSSSGVLLVELRGRVFALTFGYGYHAVDGKVIEPGFGLKVTVNVISADAVVSADTKGFNRGARSQKTILPAASQMADLGIETADEWVRQLSGKVDGEEFAATASGADSLRLSIKDFSLVNLSQKLGEILEFYKADRYKKNFGFIDNFMRIDKKDPVVSSLDAQVDAMLKARDSALAFAAPDPFEQKDVHNYRLTCRRKLVIDELTNLDVFRCLDQFSVAGEAGKKVYVEALDEQGNPVDRRLSLYEYIQAEIELDGSRYALTSGAWFRIDRDYLKRINDYVSSITDLSGRLKMHDWDKKALDADESDKTAEGSYNRMVAKDLGYELLDKKDLYFSRYEKIEICDLLTRDKELICVKSASKSSTLSHLFAQGQVSALLMHEKKYQEKLLWHLSKLSKSPRYGQPEDWTFVYAIAIDKHEPLAKSLFFFSKVKLYASANDIESRGFKVALRKIEMVTI